FAGPPVLSESIQGTSGRLPCNVTPPILEDRVALVIWFKVGLKTPIYSVDTRDSSFSEGTHWSDELYRDRLSFTVEGRSGTLAIKKTRQEDTGEYRCRVDFQKSPTRNSKVNLTVITPPESIIILDSKGATIKDYQLGPYNEGAVINITCVAVGGRPQPRVTWWHGNKEIDQSSHPLSDRRVGNILTLGKLNRENLHMQLTCQASNNNLTTPITSTVTLDLNLRPLIVKLQGENRPLSADNPYPLKCMVIGSRPAPTITWWKGSTMMKDTREESSPDGNMTTSTLTFTPTIDDRGKFLSCRAEQSMIPESGMEDGWKLDIYHIPVVSLELGTNSINSTFREGIDVFFECNIKSNPWVYKVSWRHNGNILENNLAEGIIVANQSLVLQNVSRARAGIYTCVGSNREGDGESNPVHLDIRFAPVCRPGQRFAYSSGRHEMVKIACEIEANPMEATYIWKFNATLGETIDIPASLIAVDRGRSIAHYTPMTENDYGTLLCWASNEIGDQSEPCVYTITPAGEPDPLVNCTLLNQTSTGFQIECIEGFDGGLQQDFIMEVYVNGTTRYPKIYKSKTPYFEVRGLVPGVGYNVFLVAHNTKGRSNATILQVYTLKDPEKQTVVITYKKGNFDTLPRFYELSTVTSVVSTQINNSTITKPKDRNLSLAYAPVIEDIRPFLGILVGIVGSIFLVALIIVIIVRMRGSSGRDRNNYSHPSTGGGRGNNNGSVSIGTLHNGQSIQDIRIGRDTCHVTSSLDSIDKNPDIIPQDGRDDDEEWTTKGHNRAYATAALAEQNAVITSSSYDHINPTYAVVDKKSAANHLQQLQQQQQQHQQQLPPPSHGQYIHYNALIPVSKMGGYAQQQQQQQSMQQQPNKTDLTYAELAGSASGARMAPYCSATLGRPRQTELKRAEPNIYSQVIKMMDDDSPTEEIGIQWPIATRTTAAHPLVQAAAATTTAVAYVAGRSTRIDLAHHPMYSTSPMFGGQTTITGVTMSHPSQLATFTPPPPIFAHKVISAAQSQSLPPNVAVPVSSNGLLQTMGPGGGLVCMGMPPHSAAAAASMLCAAQQQLQQQQPSPPTGVNGVSVSGYGDVNSSPGMLKTVPEEVHHHINGEDVLITKDRNHATRF
ncbi:hemicentin-1, partial [Anastrepha ludens]|uniref:hemicentin-1 n=1 Tax=Anastrepha ludens TaxID=28586 RepID=UPI0023B055CC